MASSAAADTRVRGVPVRFAVARRVRGRLVDIDVRRGRRDLLAEQASANEDAALGGAGVVELGARRENASVRQQSLSAGGSIAHPLKGRGAGRWQTVVRRKVVVDVRLTC